MKEFMCLEFRDNKLLGACIIDSDDFMTAVRLSWRLGLNPGGEVCGIAVSTSTDPKWIRRLLSPEEYRTYCKWLRAN